MADEYSKKLYLSNTNSNHSHHLVLGLAFPVKERAQDFINSLIKQYNSDGIIIKNQVLLKYC